MSHDADMSLTLAYEIKQHQPKTLPTCTYVCG